MHPVPEADLEHLAAALAALLASWYRRQQEEQEATEGKSVAKEVRDAGARPSIR
jgi:hypothetical protein